MQRIHAWAISLIFAHTAASAQPWSIPSTFYSSYYQESQTQTLLNDWQVNPQGFRNLASSWSRDASGINIPEQPLFSWRPSRYYSAEIGFQPRPISGYTTLPDVSVSARPFDGQFPMTVNAHAPLLAGAELTGRVGYLLNNSQRGDGYCFDLSGLPYACRSVPLTLGVGLQYESRNRFGLRLNYDLLDIKDSNIGLRSRSSVLSLGASVRY